MNLFLFSFSALFNQPSEFYWIVGGLICMQFFILIIKHAEDEKYQITGIVLLLLAFMVVTYNIVDSRTKSLKDKITSLENRLSSYQREQQQSRLIDEAYRKASGEGNGSNVSFEGSETSRKRGTKCHFRDYSEGNGYECSTQSNGCKGFSSQHWDPNLCENCTHHIRDHY